MTETEIDFAMHQLLIIYEQARRVYALPRLGHDFNNAIDQHLGRVEAKIMALSVMKPTTDPAEE